MTPGLWARLDLAARCSAPAAVTLFVVLIAVMPLRIPFYGPIAPILPLIAIYYWAIHRPDLMPFTVVFGIGLLQDILAGAPLGVHSFIFLLFFWMVFSQRRFLMGKPFFVLWCGFVGAALLTAGLEWLAFSLVHARPMPAAPVLFRALTTTALFPPLTWLFIQVHRGFLRQA